MYELGCVFERAGDRTAATGYYLKALAAARLRELPLMTESLSNALLAEKGLDGTLEALQQKALEAERQGDLKLATLLNIAFAQTASAHGRKAETIAAIDKIDGWLDRISADFYLPTLAPLLCDMLQAQGAWQNAAEIYSQALEYMKGRHSYSASLTQAWGYCLHKESERLAAAGENEKAIVKRTEAVKVWQTLAEEAGHYMPLIEELDSHGMHNEALRSANEALRKHPQPDVLAYKTIGLLEKGETAEATRSMTYILKAVHKAGLHSFTRNLARHLLQDADESEINTLINELSRSLNGDSE
jgi:tetratricopeptide (TPR) repeat protein